MSIENPVNIRTDVPRWTLWYKYGTEDLYQHAHLEDGLCVTARYYLLIENYILMFICIRDVKRW